MTHKDSEWNRLIAFRVLLVVPQQSRLKSRPDARPLKEKGSDNLFHLTQVSGQIRRPKRSGRSLERKNSRLFFLETDRPPGWTSNATRLNWNRTGRLLNLKYKTYLFERVGAWHTGVRRIDILYFCGLQVKQLASIWLCTYANFVHSTTGVTAFFQPGASANHSPGKYTAKN